MKKYSRAPGNRKVAADGRVWCAGCSRYLRADKFFRIKGTSSGYSCNCKRCHNNRRMRDYQNRWAKAKRKAKKERAAYEAWCKADDFSESLIYDKCVWEPGIE